jgi:1-deoxy-D-xylulose-5-phosphate synthase
MQRAYDQVIHDAALQKLQVVFCLDRAGLVGEDGATHHGAYDLSYMRCIPDLVVSAPMNEEELRNLMYTAQADNHGSFAIRYPRGNGVLPDWKRPLKKLPVGKGRMVKDGKDIAILTLGTVGNFAAEASKQLQSDLIDAAHFDLRFLKPLDTELLHKVFQRFHKVITVEDGALPGGFGSAVSEFMADNGYSATIKRLGIPDRFVEHGSLAELYRECGFDTAGIVSAVKMMVGEKILSQTG